MADFYFFFISINLFFTFDVVSIAAYITICDTVHYFCVLKGLTDGVVRRKGGLTCSSYVGGGVFTNNRKEEKPALSCVRINKTKTPGPLFVSALISIMEGFQS